MRKIALISLGCAKNLVDSEVMLGFLKRSGFDFVAEPRDADIIIINTCGFIRPARDEAHSVVDEMLKLKARYPEKAVAVTGCYVEKARPFLKKKYPEVDIWLGVKSFDRIAEAVEKKAFREPAGTFLYSHSSPRLVTTPRPWAYVKVSEGCSHECAFCTIPAIKGPYRSRPILSIVKEARELAARGVEEINLISQDTTYFGRDKHKKDALASLLRKLLPVGGLRWIRILYGYPGEISDSLLDVMTEEKVCRYLDIPFQHAEAAVIKGMNRGLDGRRALKLVGRIRKKLPDVALRTSLIVGFPGEGIGEFAGLRQFVREARFDHLGVFVYSPEEGTRAFPLGDPVPQAEKDRRRDEILRIQAEISREKNRSYVGRELDILIDGNDNQKQDLFHGRARFQAPEVDGVVFVDSSGKPFGPARSFIRRVEITSAGVYDLRGRFV